jgi:tetratricopeptide (TPR) repeat protein
MRDFPRGEAAAQKAADLQEELFSGKEGVIIVGGHVRRGHLAALQGRYRDALVHFEKEQRFLAHVDHALGARIAIELQQRIGAACLRLGLDAEGKAALQTAAAAFEDRVRVGADEPFTRYYAAGAYALLGDLERALGCLETAAAARRAYTVARARVEPEFETLRSHPRFLAVVGD